MNYHVDRTEQLAEAVKHGRFGSVASLRAAGTPAHQHNTKTTKSNGNKIASAAKKAASAKTAKQAASPKSSAKTGKKTATKKP